MTTQGKAAFLWSRVPVVAAATLLLMWLVVGSHFLGGVPRAWRALHIDAKTPSFADTRTITHSIDSVAAGKDPYTYRRLDPWNRRYNYPPIWLELRHLGVTSRSTDLIGALLGVMTLGALLCMFVTSGWTAGVLAFLAALCWPMLLALERGNTDLVVFSLMTFGLLGLSRVREPLQWQGRAALIVLLTVLKIYPIAMVVVFLKDRQGWRKAAGVALVSGVALILTSGHKLPQVLGNTPQDISRTFGSYMFASFLRWELHPPLTIRMREHFRHIASLGAILFGAAAAVYAVRRRETLVSKLPVVDVRTGPGAVAAAGLAIYCFAFTSGANYDYRLIFLLAPLAFLVRDVSRSGHRWSLGASLLLLGYLLSFFVDTVFVSEPFEPVIFLFACAWLGVSLVQPMGAARDGEVQVAPEWAASSRAA